tara:strand:- start:3029 stop:4342 length:1314 start_codon:yes stop_codon:yes gene_type:complete
MSSESKLKIGNTEFYKLIKDFLNDLFITFPEYKNVVGDEMILFHTTDTIDDIDETIVEKVFDYCKQVFPERFFDILYKNEDIFDNKEINTMFYPNIDFKDLWNNDISDKTKDVLWKYLQITLFTIVNSIDDNKSFGDTAKLFEAIDEDDLQNKMKETFENLSSLFDMSGADLSGNLPDDFTKMAEDFMSDLSGDELPDFSNLPNFDGTPNGPNMEDFMNNMPKPEDMQSHLKEMLNGKIGRLAQDIAAETAEDMPFTDEQNIGDAFEKMIKNPGKLLNLVKKIGNKIDEKIKKGDIKESELMMEATDLMNKMKDMPGMGNMNEMLNKMAGNMGGKGAKFNMNAFNQKNKMYSQKDKMLQELERRRAKKQQEDMENKEQEIKKSAELNFTKYTDINAGPNEKTPLERASNKKKRRKKKKQTTNETVSNTNEDLKNEEK